MSYINISYQAVASASAGAIEGPASVKQGGFQREEIGISAGNQMHRAALIFSDYGSWLKQQIIVLLSTPTQKWHSEQAKILKTISDTIGWEIEQIRTGIDDHIRLCLAQILFTKQYWKFGIPVAWGASGSCSADVEVCLADEQCSLVWQFCFVHTQHRERRLLTLKCGYPRNFVLLLQEDEKQVAATLAQLKTDYELFIMIRDSDEEWAESWIQRSLFQRMSVMQLIECLILDYWCLTDRSLIFAINKYVVFKC